jgi:hypothetical protein
MTSHPPRRSTPLAPLRAPRVRRRDESGESAPLTMVLGLVFVIIPTFMAVLVLPTWESRTVDAHDAARNAARALATASDWNHGVTAANQAVAEITSNNGVDPKNVTTSYTGSVQRGGTVTATIVIAIPDTYVPGIGSFGTFHYSATDTETVDPFRSGP